MSMLSEPAASHRAGVQTDRKIVQVPFNLPFNNQKHFGEIISPTVESHSLFKGKFAARVQQYFMGTYGAREVVLTASCTNALELAALLLNIKKGDEIIIPAYTYVSTANAFELRGANLRLCDSQSGSPNMDLNKLEALITPKTKAIVVIHYGGISVNMYRLQSIAQRHGILLIEDAAHAVDACYDGKPLGSFGDLATFSFHETKNITCGQGGVLLINNANLVDRARVLSNCGTNRHNFHLGLVDKYTWVDIGSVFNLSELCAAYLYPQLANIRSITGKRVELWNNYHLALKYFADKGLLRLPFVSDLCQHNAHIFYILLNSQSERDGLLHYLRERGVTATFHYSGLHQCPYYQRKYKKQVLVNAEKFAGHLLRLPLYYDLSLEEQLYVVDCIGDYFQQAKARSLRKSVFSWPFLPLADAIIGDQSAALTGFVYDVIGAFG